MKIIFFLAITSMLSYSRVFSQTKRGKIITGAFSNLSFSSSKFEGEDNSTTTFSVAPQVGYFFIDNLALGLSSNFGYRKTGEFKFTSIGVGTFVKYYFLKNKIRPFTQAQFLIGSTKNKSLNLEDKLAFTLFGIKAGAAFFINNFVSIEGALGYERTNLEEKLDQLDSADFKANNFRFDVGFNLFF